MKKSVCYLLIVLFVFFSFSSFGPVFAETVNESDLLPGMAELENDYHRKVPTEFEKTNALDDLYYFSQSSDDLNAMYENLQGGEVIYTIDDLISKCNVVYSQYGTAEEVVTDNQRTLRITTSQVPETESHATYRDTDALDGLFSEGDFILLKFKMRTVSGGDFDGNGKLQFQIEHPTTYKKLLYEYITAGSEWRQVYLPYEAKDKYCSFGIRYGFYAPQIVEIREFDIIKFSGTDYSLVDFPITAEEEHPEFEKDAQWREKALDDIEQNRKGTFSVVVKDKNGVTIPDAQVEFDMFEHEYMFGASANSRIYSNDTYAEKFSENFNTLVVENSMKWGPYEADTGEPKAARKTVDAGKDIGIKYFRGHALIWERALSTNGDSYLTPEYMFSDEVLNNRELFDEKVEAHIKEMCEAFPDMDDWDVVNELTYYDAFRQKVGDEAIIQWFQWARDHSSPETVLYYNETHGIWEYPDEFWGYLDFMKEKEIQVDAIGIQSHNDSGRKLPSPTEMIELYDKLYDEYGYRFKITEFSCSRPNVFLQASNMRDLMIATFAHEGSTGFLMWDFWDGGSFSAYAPVYTSDWQLKYAGEVYRDLVYNKWWTRDEKTMTNENGRASVKGFYGDYDVTVSYDGYEETKSCAFHKGYENVLEFVLSDYPVENSENDMFSFVYSGKVQVDGKLTSDFYDNHPYYIPNQVTLLMTDENGKIGHVAQTPIKEDKTYSFEFKKDGLVYENGKVKDYYITLNVNGIPVTNTITTSMLIPECVTFDFDITQSEGKVDVVTTLNNLILRKGLDYVVYTAFYKENNSLLGFKRTFGSSTGKSQDIITVSDLDIPDNTKYLKVLVWMNNEKLIPLTSAKTVEIN